jgi:hypothetical protein
MSHMNKVFSFETKAVTNMAVGSDAVSFLKQNITPICDSN